MNRNKCIYCGTTLDVLADIWGKNRYICISCSEANKPDSNIEEDYYD